MNNFKRTLFVNILNKALDTALIDKVILNNIFKVTLVTKLNVNTCIEKCLFTKSSFQNAVIVNRGFFKNFRVGFKAYFRTLNIRLADFLKIGYNFSSFITLEVNILAVTNLDFEPLGKCVYNRRTYAVQTARNLVTASAEFSAGVENGEYNRYGRESCFAVHADRNTTAVIGYSDYIALFDDNINFCTITCKCFVN